MALPARHGAADPGPARHEPSYRPDHPGWCDVKRALESEAEAVRLAVSDLAARPGYPAALSLAAASLRVLEDLAVITRRWGFDEKRLQALIDERVAEELAALGISRGRLRPVPPPG